MPNSFLQHAHTQTRTDGQTFGWPLCEGIVFCAVKWITAPVCRKRDFSLLLDWCTALLQRFCLSAAAAAASVTAWRCRRCGRGFWRPLSRFLSVSESVCDAFHCSDVIVMELHVFANRWTCELQTALFSVVVLACLEIIYYCFVVMLGESIFVALLALSLT